MVYWDILVSVEIGLVMVPVNIILLEIKIVQCLKEKHLVVSRFRTTGIDYSEFLLNKNNEKQ